MAVKPVASDNGVQKPQPPATFSDDISTRADTALGTIGVPQVGPAYTLSGAGVGSSRVVGGKYVNGGTGAVYIGTLLPEVPGHVRSRFSLSQITGHTYAQILSSDGSILAPANWSTLHTIVTATGFRASIWLPGIADVLVQTQVLTWRVREALSAALSTAAAITAIPVAPLSRRLAVGQVVTIESAGTAQTWTLTAAAVIGATSLAVTSQTPAFAYPAGSVVRVTSIPCDGTTLQVDQWLDVTAGTSRYEVSGLDGVVLVTYDIADPLISRVAGRLVINEPGYVGDTFDGGWAWPPSVQKVESGQIDAPSGFSGPVGFAGRALGLFSRLGIGTNVPATDLDVVETDTATAPVTEAFGLRVRGVNRHIHALSEALTPGYQAGFIAKTANGAVVRWWNSALAAMLTVYGVDRVKVDYLGVENHMTAFYLPTPAKASQTAAATYAGTGAPVNAQGADGDFYFRGDGGSLTTIYQRRAGAWVGIV